MIDRFEGPYRFLSNFWECDIYSSEDGAVYKSVEHIFQADKTNDPKEKKTIRDCATPGQAKRAGRKVTLRPDWEKIKLSRMEARVRYKFFTHKDLAELLLATGDEELVEGNDWGDDFWGVILETGKGENHLGKILMKVREELRSRK